ncbi:flavodoxin reductase family protein [Leptolyngbyaceae cyanobacterium JSC-12]|nr:flavodoxin reductase family protein [Leptolyngbyaceae cyanobacterium JSC-12]
MLVLKSVNFEQQHFHHHQLVPTRPTQTEWMIGRSTTCDLVLSSPEVSRIHARIVYTDETYYFIDVGSTSGSLINGETVPAHEQHPLHLGDLLQLGETFLYVEELAPPIAGSTVADRVSSVSETTQVWTGGDLIGRCCRIVDETPDVKTFYFVADPLHLFHYAPGQFVNLQVEIDGQPVIRPYSISSSPTCPHHLSITVKRVASPPGQPEIPAGLMSNWLHDHLQVGDRVKFLGGVCGEFTCLPNVPAKLLLISAGSGITPMMSMSRWVKDTLADCDVIFLHSARSIDDIIFRAELEIMAAQMPNFHLAVTLTQAHPRGGWMGFTGRISETMLQLVAPDFRDRAVFVCGPTPFMQSVRSLLETLQYPMQNYKEESFGGRPSTPMHSIAVADLQPASERDTFTGQLPTTGEPAIHFLKSEQRITADGSASILEVAEQEGIPIRHACRVGACGACKVRIHQGKVRYDAPPAALSATDQKAGYALACVAYPVNEIAIEA